MTLYIADPDIPGAALLTDTDQDFDADYPFTNTISGERYLLGEINATSGAFYGEYDLGVGETKSASYLIIARADKLIAQGSTSVILSGSANGLGSSYSAVMTDASFASATLLGPRSHDYLTTFTTSTAYRSWKLAFSGGSTGDRTYSKAYFGNALTLGCEPSSILFSPDPIADPDFYSTSGAEDPVRLNELPWRFELMWPKVSDDLTTSFIERIAKKAEHTRFFLYTTSNHHVLNDLKCVHVEMTSHEVTNNREIRDYNQITASFTEVLG